MSDTNTPSSLHIIVIVVLITGLSSLSIYKGSVPSLCGHFYDYKLSL